MTTEDAARIHTSDGEPREVTLALTHPRGGGQMPTVRLRVEEAMSNQCLVEVELTAEQFTALVASQVINVQGARITPTPGRIGKRMQNTATSLNRLTASAEAERVRDNYLASGWQSVRIDETNFGHRVVAYRWVEDEATS